MLISEALQYAQIILNEYTNNKNSLFSGFYGQNMTAGDGKKADSIAAGEAKPYKDPSYLTEYELQYPELAKVTQRAKLKFPNVLLEIPPAARKELAQLISNKSELKRDEKNRIIIPAGDNIRLVRQNNQLYLIYIDPKAKTKNTPDKNVTDTTV